MGQKKQKNKTTVKKKRQRRSKRKNSDRFRYFREFIKRRGIRTEVADSIPLLFHATEKYPQPYKG